MNTHREGRTEKHELEEVSGSDLLAQIESGTAPAILDVRSRAEFRRGHVPGAVHVPFWTLRWHLHRVPASRADSLVVYCGHGPRAWLAGGLLRRRGYSRVSYLSGHFSGWRAAGLREERERA